MLKEEIPVISKQSQPQEAESSSWLPLPSGGKVNHLPLCPTLQLTQNMLTELVPRARSPRRQRQTVPALKQLTVLTQPETEE